MNCYKAGAVSRNDIREYVHLLRTKVGLEEVLYFPVILFAENILPILIPDYQFDVASEKEMGVKHGETCPDKNIIRIREDVYLRALRGKGRDRLTVAHEIGHLFMHEGNAVALCRLPPNGRLKPFEDPEWQANAFGGELLASSYLIDGMSVNEVSEKCGVSISAAKVQLRALR